MSQIDKESFVLDDVEYNKLKLLILLANRATALNSGVNNLLDTEDKQDETLDHVVAMQELKSQKTTIPDLEEYFYQSCIPKIMEQKQAFAVSNNAAESPNWDYEIEDKQKDNLVIDLDSNPDLEEDLDMDQFSSTENDDNTV